MKSKSVQSEKRKIANTCKAIFDACLCNGMNRYTAYNLAIDTLYIEYFKVGFILEKDLLS